MRNFTIVLLLSLMSGAFARPSGEGHDEQPASHGPPSDGGRGGGPHGGRGGGPHGGRGGGRHGGHGGGRNSGAAPIGRRGPHGYGGPHGHAGPHDQMVDGQRALEWAKMASKHGKPSGAHDAMSMHAAARGTVCEAEECEGMASILNHTGYCVSGALHSAANVSQALEVELECVRETQSALIELSPLLAPYVDIFGSIEDSVEPLQGKSEQDEAMGVQYLVAQQVGFMSEIRRSPRYAPLFTPPPQPCVHGEVLVRATTVTDARTGELVGESTDTLRFRVNCAEEGEDYEVIVHEEVGMRQGSPSTLLGRDDHGRDHDRHLWWNTRGEERRHHHMYIMVSMMMLSLICCCAVRRIRHRRRCAAAGYPGCAAQRSADPATVPLSPTKETFEYPPVNGRKTVSLVPLTV